MICTNSCVINSLVGGDHAYCTCRCHPDDPAVPPSRERKRMSNYWTVEEAQAAGEAHPVLCIHNKPRNVFCDRCEG